MARSTPLALILVAGCYRGPGTTETTATSRREPSDADAKAAAEQFTRNLPNPPALRAMFDTGVRVSGLDLLDQACADSLSGHRTLLGSKLDTLAKCLGELAREVPPQTHASITRPGTFWAARLESQCWILSVELNPRTDGTLAIAAIDGTLKCTGVEGGFAGGVVGGVVGGAPPPPAPPPPPGTPAPPQNVPPTLLEGSRIAGTKQIAPDDATKIQIAQSNKDTYVGSWKLCIDVAGTVVTVKQLKSTGLPAYDAKIQQEMSTNWRYKPYEINGKAVPVCTAVTFIYKQHGGPSHRPPPPPPPSP
jgi:hypothetical protein